MARYVTNVRSSIENINRQLAGNKRGLVCISTGYERNTEVLAFRCTRGHVTYSTPVNKIRSAANGCGCRPCAYLDSAHKCLKWNKAGKFRHYMKLYNSFPRYDLGEWPDCRGAY